MILYKNPCVFLVIDLFEKEQVFAEDLYEIDELSQDQVKAIGNKKKNNNSIFFVLIQLLPVCFVFHNFQTVFYIFQFLLEVLLF